MKTLVNTLVAIAVSAICYSSVSGSVKNKAQGNEKQKFAIEKLTWFTGRWVNQEGKNTVVRLIAAKPTPNEQKAKE